MVSSQPSTFLLCLFPFVQIAGNSKLQHLLSHSVAQRAFDNADWRGAGSHDAAPSERWESCHCPSFGGPCTAHMSVHSHCLAVGVRALGHGSITFQHGASAKPHRNGGKSRLGRLSVWQLYDHLRSGPTAASAPKTKPAQSEAQAGTISHTSRSRLPCKVLQLLIYNFEQCFPQQSFFVARCGLSSNVRVRYCLGNNVESVSLHRNSFELFYA